MFKSISVATDLSDASDHVVGCVSPLCALLVYCLGIRRLQESQHPSAPMAEPKRQAQKASLAQAGSLVTEILKTAQDDGASLIAMGSQGRAHISGLLLSSVSHNVVRRAGVPVLLVPLSR